MSPVVTIAEAAELLRCGRSQVFALLAAGRLPRAPRFGKVTTIPRDAVLALLDVSAPPRPAQRRKRSTRGARAEAALLAVPLTGS